MKFSLRQLIFPDFRNDDDLENKIRYLLAYQICLFITIAIGLYLVSAFIYFQPLQTVLSLIGFGGALWTTIYIYFKKRYEIPALIFAFIGAIATDFSLFYVENRTNYVIAFWIIINIFYAFTVLRYKWGLFFIAIHCITFSLHIALNPESRNNIIDYHLTVSAIINVVICFSIISYIFWVNFSITEISKNKLQESKQLLNFQYDIISKQNEEKVVMLKEIHHRVKNNLQIITSLLRLQARELESPEAISKFKDATNRVIAISMVHERMYQSDELSTLSLKDYLQELSRDLLSSYQAGYEVEMRIDCDIEKIGLKAIVPIALIINELISNSLKYAFDSNENCWISISFMRHKDTFCKITYRDSGTWKAPSRTGTFGMDLIESLVYQMEGTLDISTFPDTVFEIVFTPQDE
jgi:two-component sensor histidine kinase